jgi:hypothetical protein
MPTRADKDGATMLRDSRPVGNAEEDGEIQYDIGAHDDVHDSNEGDEEDEEYDDDEDTAPQVRLVYHSQQPNCPSPTTLLGVPCLTPLSTRRFARSGLHISKNDK